VFLLAALPPANDAAPAEDPPKPPENAAAEKPDERQREREEITRLLNQLEEQIRVLHNVPQNEAIKAQVAKLEAKKLELEIKTNRLQVKQIRVFRLKHVKPEEVRQALNAVFGVPIGYGQAGPFSKESVRSPAAPLPGSYGPPPGVGASPTPAPNQVPGSLAPARQPGTPSADDVHDWRLTIDDRTQSIIMRGSRNNLRLAADLIALLDVPDGKPIQKGDGKLVPKGKILQAFKLKYARADTLAEILDQLGTEAHFLPLKQTNRLIVAGPETVVKEIADLIEQLDVEGKGEGATP